MSSQPRRIFWGISSFQALAMFRRGLFYAYLSIYLRHFLGMSVTETTLFATLPMVMNIITQTMLWGPFSDRHQLRRTLIVTGELLAGAGTIVVWYAHTLTAHRIVAGYVIIIGLSLVEVFWSMSNVGWSALISDLYHERDRNAVQGKLASVGGLGRIVGVWIGGLLYDGMGLHYEGWGFYEGGLFFVAAGVMAISIFPMLAVPEGGIRQEPVTTRTSGRATTPAPHLFAFFLISMVFINFGRNAIAIIQTQYLVLDTGFAVSSVTLSHIVNTQSAAMVITGLIAGWISRRLGDGRSLITGTVLAVISLFILASTDRLGMIYVSNFLRGFSDVIIMAASYAMASVLIPPRQRARDFGYFNATFFLSWGVAGTLIAGPIIDVLMARGTDEQTAYRIAFAAAGVMATIGLIMIAVLIFRMGRDSGDRLADRNL